MFRERFFEFWVGIFLLLGIISLCVLAFKVSGLTGYFGKSAYRVTADFDNVGGLKVRSQVTVAGVRIGEVSMIDLNPKTFKARVTMNIHKDTHAIPDDSIASIYTEGLLGANYISLTPGFSDNYLKEGSVIEETHSALVLEDLIGQFIFSSQKKENK